MRGRGELALRWGRQGRGRSPFQGSSLPHWLGAPPAALAQPSFSLQAPGSTQPRRLPSPAPASQPLLVPPSPAALPQPQPQGPHRVPSPLCVSVSSPAKRAKEEELLEGPRHPPGQRGGGTWPSSGSSAGAVARFRGRRGGHGLGNAGLCEAGGAGRTAGSLRTNAVSAPAATAPGNWTAPAGPQYPENNQWAFNFHTITVLLNLNLMCYCSTICSTP